MRPTLVRVKMPAPDGAPFHCSKVVPKPAPIFWDECGLIAVFAYKDDWDPDSFLKLRCHDHKELE